MTKDIRIFRANGKCHLETSLFYLLWGPITPNGKRSSWPKLYHTAKFSTNSSQVNRDYKWKVYLN